MILAIDTTTRYLSLALANETTILAESTWYTADNHTVELAPAIQQMLLTAGTTAADLQAVGVALGPGSFTGLRIGMGLAKGLALAHNLEIVGVPTHDIIASPQPRFDGTLLAVLQVGRSRIAAARYQLRQDRWISKNMSVITTWADLLNSAESTDVYICGEVDAEGRSILGDRFVIGTAAMNVRRSACLVEITQARIQAGDSDNPEDLIPIYLQQPSNTLEDTVVEDEKEG